MKEIKKVREKAWTSYHQEGGKERAKEYCEINKDCKSKHEINIENCLMK